MKNKRIKLAAGVVALGIAGVMALTGRAEAPVQEEVLSQLPQEVVENTTVEETVVEFEVENTSNEASKKETTPVECPQEEKIEATIVSSTKEAETSATVEAPAEIAVEDNSKELNDTVKAVEAAKDNRIFN